MAALSCEICGGKLMAKSGGIFECDSCGMQYDKTRIQEMVQEIKGIVKVEGTVEVQGTVKLDGPVEVKGGTSKENLVKRAKMKLEDAAYVCSGTRWFLAENSDYHPIKALLEQALEIDPEYGEALLYMVLIENGCKTVDEFRAKYVRKQEKNKTFQRFRQFAKDDLAILANDIQHEFDAEAARLEKARLQKEAEERIAREKKEEEERIACEKQKRKAEADQAKRELSKINLPPVRERLLPVQKRLAAGGEHTVCLNLDGTVTSIGDNRYGQCKTGRWRNIVAVSAMGERTVGLKADGTVVAAGFNSDKQNDLSDWTDIVAIAVGHFHTVGLKSNGTVVARGRNSSGQCDVFGWHDIVAISAGREHTVGLKADGTVVAVGYNADGPCNTSDWCDIVAISAGFFHTVGLCSDGTVVAVGNTSDGKCNVSKWRDIVAISAGTNHTVGLKADGTVVATGYRKEGQCNVGAWRDIVAISGGSYHTVALEADGSVVAVGYNHDGQCGVYAWKLFRNIYTLEEEVELHRRRAAGLCQHCGGELKGVLGKKCVSCGKPKDY